MATIQVQVTSGQLVAATSGEKEIQFPAWVTDVSFFLAVGATAVKITTGVKGGQDIIGGSINDFIAGDRGVMRVEGAEGTPGQGRSIFIKGSGGVVFIF